MESTNNYITQEDLWHVLDGIPKLKIRKWLDYDVMMLFKILYWSALRPMEGIKLRKEDFNLTNRVINLGQTKTHKNDRALIPVRFCTELQAWLDGKEDGELFVNLSYHVFYTWLKRLGKMYNVEAWLTHQNDTGEKTVGHLFRKSIGKSMIYGEITDNKGDKFQIPTISKLMRHAKPSITQDHYLKASMQQVAEIY